MKLSKNITEYAPFPGTRVFIAPTKARDVVAVVGSVYGGENMLPTSLEAAIELATELLDAGTSKTSKADLRNSLANRGATISFSSGGDRTYFSGSCLPEDLQFLLKIIAECLGDAVFAASEIKLMKRRALGDLTDESMDTRIQAANALSRMIYDKGHVNYATPTKELMKQVTEANRTDLLKYRSLLGKGGLVLSIAGDVSVPETMKSVEQAFKTLGDGTQSAAVKNKNLRIAKGTEQKIAIADKANIDVYFGGVVPLTYNSELYLPFITLSNMLGGRGFVNHLMQTLRERDSLTYVAYALPGGFQEGTEGSLRIWTAFSPVDFKKSIDALRREIDFFFKKGITTEHLAVQQDRMIGTSLIGLSTTRGLAQALHSVGIEGRPLEYVDEFASLVRSITIEQLHAVAALIPYESFSLAAAGTFVK